MPVRKFRSIEEASAPEWRQPGDPALRRVMAALWARGRQLHGARFPAGVHRYRSIEELDAQVARWQQAHVDRRRHLLEPPDEP